MPLDDVQLVERILATRDEGAFRVLAERFATPALRVALSVTRDRQAAEDAVQEAFFVVSRKLRRFDRRRALRPWILGIVYRCAQKIAGRRARAGRREEAAPMEHSFDPRPHDAAERRETLHALGEEVESLPPQQRVPILLHYAEGLSYAEVAESLGIRPGTAKSRVGRALERLRAGLARRGVAFGAGGLAGLLGDLPRATAGDALIELCARKGVAGLAAPAFSGVQVALATAFIVATGAVVAVHGVGGSSDRDGRAPDREQVAGGKSLLADSAGDPERLTRAADAKQTAAVNGRKPVGAAAEEKKGPFVNVGGKKIPLSELLGDKNRVRVGPDGRIQRGPIVVPPSGTGNAGGAAPMRAPGRFDENGNWQWPKTPKFAQPPRHHGTATLAGRVVDASGAPLAGARVWRIVEDAPREETTAISAEFMDEIAKTDAEGRFEVEHQKPGRMLLFADFQGSAVAPGIGLETKDAKAVVARPGERTDGIVLPVPVVLSDQAKVVGLVLDPEGKPVARAQVWLDRRLRRSTGLDGRFELGPIAPGEYMVTVEETGYVATEVPVTLAAKETRELTVDLLYLNEGELRLAGQVLDKAGNPVAGASIFLGAGSGTVREQVSDVAGNYAFEKLPDELLELDVSVHVWAPKGYFGTYVKKVGLPNDAFTLRLDRSAEIVAVVTSAADGNPVSQINYKLFVPVVKEGIEKWIPKQTGAHFDETGRIDDIDFAIGSKARLQIEAPGHEIWEMDLDTNVDGPKLELTISLTPSAAPEPEEDVEDTPADPNAPTDQDTPTDE